MKLLTAKQARKQSQYMASRDQRVVQVIEGVQRPHFSLNIRWDGQSTLTENGYQQL